MWKLYHLFFCYLSLFNLSILFENLTRCIIQNKILIAGNILLCLIVLWNINFKYTCISKFSFNSNNPWEYFSIIGLYNWLASFISLGSLFRLIVTFEYFR